MGIVWVMLLELIFAEVELLLVSAWRVYPKM
jgi:hypothetical protein